MTKFNDFGNPQVARLPNHLKQFIVEQQYEKYTPVDQAVWRYVMRQNYSYLKDVAYYPYIPGLKKAGLTIEKIPDLQDMNNALAKIGWGAVTVDGFIPPAAFMEYQAYRVLVIAADIRQLKHIEYTPAPDIIHESAGHAPIIADYDYHQYLSYFGSIGAKAMFSSKDYALYEAIRELSILKEVPGTSPEALQEAEEKVAWWQANLGEPSEMALLSRLHWWTVEYGLIGSLEDPKIYGAGLLSSIGESAGCMRPEVAKYWYTIDAVNYPFDITKPQPQLFVTPDFQNLINVLEQFADTMAFRTGGMQGMLKAIECKNVCTAVLSSGLQVSGVFEKVEQDTQGNITFFKTSGPTALAYDNKQLDGHDKHYHGHGFSSPLGLLKGRDNALENLSKDELGAAGMKENEEATLQFESGITVSGKITSFTFKNNRLILVSFVNCTVTGKGGQIYFSPEWGVFDMAVGSNISSVYCGAADKDAFHEIALVPKTKTVKLVYTPKELLYHQLFAQVRKCRENNTGFELLPEIWEGLQQDYKDDWLCALEILELLASHHIYPKMVAEIKAFLVQKADRQPEYSKLIQDGLYVIEHPVFENETAPA